MTDPKAGETGLLAAQTDNRALHDGNMVIDDSQFRQLADNLPTLCWMADPDGYIFWFNRRMYEYCGKTPAELMGWGWQSVHDPEILPDVIKRWAGCIATGLPFEMTFPLRHADGVFHPFLTRVQPMLDANGAVEKWFGTNVDVTAQVAAETELRLSNQKFREIAAQREAILSQLSEGVIITDPSGRITFVNEAASRLHGVTELNVEPADYAKTYSLLTEDGMEHPIESLPLTRAVRDQEAIVDARWKIRRPDGSEILAMGNAKPVYTEDHALIGAVLTIRDDTSRHAAEAALAHAVRIKDILLQEVNHRVKNNLQLVTSLLLLQADRTNLPEVRASLVEASSRVGVVAGMHQRLYTSSSEEKVDLAVYLRLLANETITALDGEKRIDLTFTCGDQIPVLLDNAVPIALIINELLTNAVKYAFDDSRGHITLTIRRENATICITLSDNGKGLPKDFSLEASTGLGMLIVTALVGQIDGSLAIIAQDRGTAFAITMPFDRLVQSATPV